MLYFSSKGFWALLGGSCGLMRWQRSRKACGMGNKTIFGKYSLSQLINENQKTQNWYYQRTTGYKDEKNQASCLSYMNCTIG